MIIWKEKLYSKPKIKLWFLVMPKLKKKKKRSRCSNILTKKQQKLLVRDTKYNFDSGVMLRKLWLWETGSTSRGPHGVHACEDTWGPLHSAFS